jgi:cell division protein FtsW
VLKGRLKKQSTGVDKTLFYLIILLTVLGLIAVADASAPQALNVFKDKFYFVKQQAVWAAFGFFLLLVIAKIKYSFWEKIATIAFWGSLVLLVIVLIPGVGSRVLGARRWIFLGPISIQPSEIIKFTLALYLAKLGAKEKGIISYLVPVGLTAILIMLQPDLGTTLIVLSIAIAQIFVSGIGYLKFIGVSILGFLGSLGFALSSSYRRERLLTFLQQSQDPLGRDYHLRQILLALGSGGLLGVGLGSSRQKFLFLPEAATDSIFAIIAEEIGFIGAGIIIFILIIFILRALKIAQKAPDKFSFMLGTGIVVWIASQVVLNIGSMVSLVPLTGVPLPFFSYGGSALSMILASCGILLNISKYTYGHK